MTYHGRVGIIRFDYLLSTKIKRNPSMKVTRAVILPALLLLAACSSAVTEKEKY